MKKLFLAAIVLAVAIAAISVYNETDPGVYNVGFAYFKAHPAIDQGIAGYKEQIGKEFPEGAAVIKTSYANAHGEIKNVNDEMRSFISKKYDAIIALTTPVAQVANRLVSKTPVIFVGVSDPVAAGLVDALSQGRANVTGTTSKDPVFETLQLALSVFPEVRSVGIIYASFEANSDAILRMLEKKVDKHSLPITIVKRAVNSTAEIHSAAASLADSVDAYFLINDNTVISGVKIILRIADERKIPVFASDVDSVKSGALLTLGLNYRDEGVQAAKILKKILVERVLPEDIPVYVNQKYYLYVNEKIYRDFPNANTKPLTDATVVN